MTYGFDPCVIVFRWLGVSAKHLLPNNQEQQHDKAVSWANLSQVKFIPLPSGSIGNFIKRSVIHSSIAIRATKTGQDSLLDKALDYRLKGTGFILASTTKCAQHERLIVSPCEMIKICWSFVFIIFFFIWLRPVLHSSSFIIWSRPVLHIV
jgi:hypothetical protein